MGSENRPARKAGAERTLAGGLGGKTYKVSEELKRLRLVEAGIVMKMKALF